MPLTEVLSIESIDKELMLKARATVRLFFMSLLLLDVSFGEPWNPDSKSDQPEPGVCSQVDHLLQLVLSKSMIRQRDLRLLSPEELPSV